jgi:hypothetical protein
VLVSIVDFVDPTDGLPIIAGRTRCSEDADVVRMFPDRFKPCPDWGPTDSRALIRAGGTSTVTADADEPQETPPPSSCREENVTEPQHGLPPAAS